MKLDKGTATAEVEAPASGCRVFFIEHEYPGGSLSYFFSTQLRIIGEPEKQEKKEK